jgi:hypothetical protein
MIWFDLRTPPPKAPRGPFEVWWGWWGICLELSTPRVHLKKYTMRESSQHLVWKLFHTPVNVIAINVNSPSFSDLKSFLKQKLFARSGSAFKFVNWILSYELLHNKFLICNPNNFWKLSYLYQVLWCYDVQNPPIFFFRLK